MSYSFPTTPFASASILAYFFSLVNWLLSQAAPWLMILFAIVMVGMVVRVIYDSIHPAEVDYLYEDEEDD